MYKLCATTCSLLSFETPRRLHRLCH